MQTKQIGFEGIKDGADLVHHIDNGPIIPNDATVETLGQLTNGQYVWADGFLFTEVEPEAMQQVIHLTGVDGEPYIKTSVDFFGGRPHRPH